MSKIKNITVKNVEYKVPDGPYKKYEAEIKALFPKKKREIISFEITDTNTRTANAIRRTVIDEMPVKILTTSIEDIYSDEEYLIPAEFIDRLNNLPIDQTLDENLTFRIDVVNKNTKEPRSIVYADAIGEKSFSQKDFPWDPKFRLAQLHPTKYLNVENIHIITGYGYENAKFQTICGVHYQPLDYVDVNVVNERGFYVRKMVSVKDVLAADKSVNLRTVHGKRILVQPPGCVPHRPSKFDIIVKKELKTYSSSTTHPAHFLLEFETLGTVPAKKLIKMACDNLIARLKKVQAALEKPGSDPDITIKSGETTHVMIVGETHTIAELLMYNAWLIDPNINHLSKKLPHAHAHDITVNIQHAQPLKILADACERGITDFTSIGKNF